MDSTEMKLERGPQHSKPPGEAIEKLGARVRKDIRSGGINTFKYTGKIKQEQFGAGKQHTIGQHSTGFSVRRPVRGRIGKKLKERGEVIWKAKRDISVPKMGERDVKQFRTSPPHRGVRSGYKVN
jgi:hypothetical protein